MPPGEADPVVHGATMRVTAGAEHSGEFLVKCTAFMTSKDAKKPKNA